MIIIKAKNNEENEYNSLFEVDSRENLMLSVKNKALINRGKGNLTCFRSFCDELEKKHGDLSGFFCTFFFEIFCRREK